MLKREQEAQGQLWWLEYCLPSAFEVTNFAELHCAEMCELGLVSLVRKATKTGTV